jgi:hypothetical protein
VTEPKTEIRAVEALAEQFETTPDQLITLVRHPSSGWYWLLPSGNCIPITKWDLKFETAYEAPRFKGQRRKAAAR